MLCYFRVVMLKESKLCQLRDCNIGERLHCRRESLFCRREGRRVTGERGDRSYTVGDWVYFVGDRNFAIEREEIKGGKLWCHVASFICRQHSSVIATVLVYWKLLSWPLTCALSGRTGLEVEGFSSHIGKYSVECFWHVNVTLVEMLCISITTCKYIFILNSILYHIVSDVVVLPTV